MVRRSTVGGILAGLVACGGSSGLDANLMMRELDATQQAQWCDYATSLEIEACGTSTTGTGEYSSEECLAEFAIYANCDITVGTMEECYGELEADSCTGGLSEPCLEYFTCVMSGFGMTGS